MNSGELHYAKYILLEDQHKVTSNEILNPSPKDALPYGRAWWCWSFEGFSFSCPEHCEGNLHRSMN